MGILSRIASVPRRLLGKVGASSDEVKASADEIAEAVDKPVDELTAADAALYRAMTEAGQTGQVAAKQGRSAIVGVAGAGAGAYALPKVWDRWNDRKATQELQEQIEAVRNDSTLTEAEKEARIEQLRDQYQQEVEEGGSAGGILGAIIPGILGLMLVYAVSKRVI